MQFQVGSNGYTVADGPGPAQYFDDAQLVAKFKLADQGHVVPRSPDFGPVHADLNTGLNLWRLDGRPLPQAF